MALTDFQKTVIDRLRKADCHWIADATEKAWGLGQRYYIDSRVDVSKVLRIDLGTGNVIATTR